jgi:2-keto-4-pentenoate hydratase/2-oxohepta-3-ene-1,7-dioic acid hydratase in catechol pathway
MDKIICVGKNYLKHALELGDAVPEEPVYFFKPPSALFAGGEVLEIPKHGEVHHELELVFKIGAPNRLTHYTFGLDLTLRDLQSRLKKSGQPWEKAKVFKNSAVLGPWRELDKLERIMGTRFELKVNGQTRQKGVGSDMRWKPLELLSDLQGLVSHLRWRRPVHRHPRGRGSASSRRPA